MELELAGGLAPDRCQSCRSVQSLSLSPPTPDDAAYGVLVACIEAAQAAGVMVREPIPQLAFAAWSMVHGVASLILDGPDTTLAPDLATAELLARSCVATLAEGFRVR